MPVKTHFQEMIPFGSLRDDPLNPRTIPQQTLARLKASLGKFGFVEAVVARKSDGLVIGGHQRRLAFKELSLEEGKTQAQIDNIRIPVIFVDGLSDAEAKLLNLTLNKSLGEWDYSKLSTILADLTAQVPDELELSGFGQVEISDILGLVAPVSNALSDLTGEEPEAPPIGTVKLLECPACHHTWAK